MNKRIILLSFALLSVLFLTAQTCTFSYLQYDYDCSDGMQSSGESGIDCGGSYCDPCVSEEEVEEEEAVEEVVEEETVVEEEVEETPAEEAVEEEGVDSDADGLTDAEEAEYGTDANDADSDDDGLTDQEEITSTFTDPLLEDTDDDNISDSEEVNTYGTDPLSADSDGDGVSDQVEIEYVGTDAMDATDYPAIADCGGSYVAVVGEEVTLDGSASIEGTRTISHYYWNMGDGSTSGPQTAATYAYTYSAAGEYTVMLLLRGDSGTLLDYCTTTATITEAEEVVDAYQVTDITDASIDGTIGSTLIHFYNYESLDSSTSGWPSMGWLTMGTNSYSDWSGNPSAESPLLVGIASRYWSGIDTERTLTVTAADGSTFDLYLPVVDASVLTGYSMVFYVAADGSTHYADADHTGVLSERSNLLAPEEALTADHLARAAPTG